MQLSPIYPPTHPRATYLDFFLQPRIPSPDFTQHDTFLFSLIFFVLFTESYPIISPLSSLQYRPLPCFRAGPLPMLTSRTKHTHRGVVPGSKLVCTSTRLPAGSWPPSTQRPAFLESQFIKLPLNCHVTELLTVQSRLKPPSASGRDTGIFL